MCDWRWPPRSQRSDNGRIELSLCGGSYHRVSNTRKDEGSNLPSHSCPRFLGGPFCTCARCAQRILQAILASLKEVSQNKNIGDLFSSHIPGSELAFRTEVLPLFQRVVGQSSSRGESLCWRKIGMCPETKQARMAPNKLRILLIYHLLVVSQYSSRL